jgi:hypothetical protein
LAIWVRQLLTLSVSLSSHAKSPLLILNVPGFLGEFCLIFGRSFLAFATDDADDVARSSQTDLAVSALVTVSIYGFSLVANAVVLVIGFLVVRFTGCISLPIQHR